MLFKESTAIVGNTPIIELTHIEEEFDGKNVVVLFTDSGDRYLSTALFEK